MTDDAPVYMVIDDHGIPRPIDVAEDGSMSFVNGEGKRIGLKLREKPQD